MTVLVNLRIDVDSLEVLAGFEAVPVTYLLADRPSRGALLNPIVSNVSTIDPGADKFVVTTDCHKFASSNTVGRLKHDGACASLAQEFFNVGRNVVEIVLRPAGAPTTCLGLLKVHWAFRAELIDSSDGPIR